LTPERWAQIEELFHRAAECGPEERTLLLDEACSNDPVLRREVETLLSCDASAGDYVQAAVRAEIDTVGFPLSGETISHYRILDGLGGGGMGLVYRAQDIKLGRQVALKFLPEELANDPAALARFEREARSASALEHPNICPIYEFGEHEGRTFLVMQLLEGRTLREWIASAMPGKPPFGIKKLLDLAIQIMDGLDAAHHKGIIHRDIKPANIFVTSQGEAKILDFGLAKLASAVTVGGEEMEQGSRDGRSADATPRENVLLPTPDLLLSRTGVALGTAGYMSPEQVRGEKLDARTDLFSFALVLYEMATGHRAFEGDTGPALRNAILTQTPVPARQLNPELPPKLGQIISKALEKNRDARYQTVSDMRTDVEILKHKAERQIPVRQWMLASALVFALLIVSVSWWFARRQPSSTQTLPDIKFRQLTLNSSENPVRNGAISPNGKYLAYIDKLGMHVKDIGTGSIQAVTQPRELNKESFNWEIRDVGWFPDNTRFLANAHPASEDPGAWSSRTASIWVFSRTGEPRRLREHATAWSVSPNGALISFGTIAARLGERETWLMDSEGKQARKLFDAGENSSFNEFYWSPDSQRGLCFRTDAPGDTLLSRDLQGGPPVTLLTPAETKQIRGDISWLPDGRLIYQLSDPGWIGPGSFASPQDTCNFWTMQLDVHTGKSIENAKRLTNWTGFCSSEYANATADGKRLAFLRQAVAWTVYVADVEAGGMRIGNMRHFTLDESSDFLQDWTNDSKQVVFMSDRTGQLAIYKQSLEADAPERISTGTDGSLGNTAVSPDGKWLLGIPSPKSGDSRDMDRLVRIPLAGGSPELVTTIASAQVRCARQPSTLCVLAERTEDRKRLIFTSIDALKGRGLELARFDLDPGIEYWQFDISPDGTRLAVSRNLHGPIHILSLRGHAEQVIPAKFNDFLGNFYWAADGKGLYVADLTKRGTVLSYVDVHGNAHVLWVNPSGWMTWAKPSPDGHHLAIEGPSVTSNIWMMENF
jgi:serine/threonine protein kinase